MQQVYNGTPIPIKGRAEGITYIIPAGEVVEIENNTHAETLLRNFEARGLLRVRFGDKVEELAERSIDALRAHLQQSADERKRHNLEQARLGLKAAPPSPELRQMLQEVFGQDVSATDETGLGTIRLMAQAIKKMEDGPRKAKLQAALEELSALQAEADGIAGTVDDPDAIPVEVGAGAAIQRARARRRQGSKGKK